MKEVSEGLVVCEFRVAVEEEGGVVRVGEAGRVKLLEVGSEVHESLGVEELPEPGLWCQLAESC